jgi:hypothetical protein
MVGQDVRTANEREGQGMQPPVTQAFECDTELYLCCQFATVHGCFVHTDTTVSRPATIRWQQCWRQKLVAENVQDKAQISARTSA